MSDYLNERKAEANTFLEKAKEMGFNQLMDNFYPDMVVEPSAVIPWSTIQMLGLIRQIREIYDLTFFEAVAVINLTTKVTTADLLHEFMNRTESGLDRICDALGVVSNSIPYR